MQDFHLNDQQEIFTHMIPTSKQLNICLFLIGIIEYFFMFNLIGWATVYISGHLMFIVGLIDRL